MNEIHHKYAVEIEVEHQKILAHVKAVPLERVWNPCSRSLGLLPGDPLEESVEALGGDRLQGAEDSVAAIVEDEVLWLRNLSMKM